MNKKPSIIVVGAGACGLVAARHLVQAGKSVLILEARERLGGRIWPLSEEEFGYPAEGGAEFVHGEAPVTHSLLKEAGLTYSPMDGEMWRLEHGDLVEGGREFSDYDLLQEKLSGLQRDVSIAQFLAENFSEPRFDGMRKSILAMVKGFDAADPARSSTIAVRDEFLGSGHSMEQGRIKEGYGPLLDFLEGQCRTAGCEVRLGCEVKGIDYTSGATVQCANGETHHADKVIVSVPLPILSQIHFAPAAPQKLEAANKIGYGSVLKVLMHFHEPWWRQSRGHDLSRMQFVFSSDTIPVWWTQYPEIKPTLTGWLGGPDSEKFKDMPADDIAALALDALSNIFGAPRQAIRKELAASAMMNWSADPFAQGAYSYKTLDGEGGRHELLTPLENTIFFAGEALAEGTAASTVEGAFASGLDTARQVLLT